jgi:ATP-dependent Lon protease
MMLPYSNAGDGQGAEFAQREVPEAAIEWAARLGRECRRRVKEQQNRIGSAEFRNTRFSYEMGIDG